MGRTLPTFTMLVEQEAARWAKFRRALRREDQEAFDALLAAARYHAAAGAYASDALPFETMLLSMLVAQQRQIDTLQKRLARHEPCAPPGLPP
jgi:hypothetical protein